MICSALRGSAGRRSLVGLAIACAARFAEPGPHCPGGHRQGAAGCAHCAAVRERGRGHRSRRVRAPTSRDSRDPLPLPPIGPPPTRCRHVDLLRWKEGHRPIQKRWMPT
eukprot:9485673-Pyramimonas_sp.AAC.4